MSTTRDPRIIEGEVVGGKQGANTGSDGPKAGASSTAPRKSKKQIAIMLLAIAYVLSPLDLIPEAFLGPIGFLDDIGVLAWAARNFFRKDGSTVEQSTKR